MGPIDEVVESICRLPLDFQAGNVSAVELVRRSGYRSLRPSITEDLVVACLSEHPNWVAAWFEWSGDKRTDRGWFVTDVGPDTFVVGHYPPSEIRPERHFDDRVAACAAFVIAELDDLTAS